MHKPTHERKGIAFPRSKKVTKDAMYNLHKHKLRIPKKPKENLEEKNKRYKYRDRDV